jgi:riboflavin synthase
MFSGIVEAMGSVTSATPAPPGMRLTIDLQTLHVDARIGDSIAVNGCCLTIVALDDSRATFDLGAETLARTNLGQLQLNSPVNLERAMKLSDRLGGHLVSGHIDTIATLDTRTDEREWSTCWFRLPTRWTRQMVSKGSVAIDGISLTIVDVEPKRFSVMLIPHTLAVTTLGRRQVGDLVNIETDLLAKYVERQLNFQPNGQS